MRVNGLASSPALLARTVESGTNGPDLSLLAIAEFYFSQFNCVN